MSDVSNTRPVYFFLSYAHLPPEEDSVDVDYDPVVRAFFGDLSARVRARVDSGDLDVGFYDGAVPTGEDLRATLGRALGEAEVLVPLFSPRYLRGAWPMSEYDSFRRRLAQAANDTTGHIQPVLWVPLPPGDELPDGEQLADLGLDPVDYEENGLRMMHELSLYRDDYEAAVVRLAERIVEAVRARPLGPALTPPVVGTQTGTTAGTPQFVIAVIAPTSADLPPDPRPQAYGSRRVEWRPFPGTQALPVAVHAANVAERLGLTTAVVDGPDAVKLMEERPTVLLIDPWILDVPHGESLLEDAVRGLRDWVTPIIVSDASDLRYAERARALSEQVDGMLARARSPRAPRYAKAAGEFMNTLPQLVTQARRRFLKRLPIDYSPRPRLTDPHPSPSPSPGAEDR